MTKNNTEPDIIEEHVRRLEEIFSEPTEEMGPLETKFVEEMREHLKRYRAERKETDND